MMPARATRELGEQAMRTATQLALQDALDRIKYAANLVQDDVTAVMATNDPVAVINDFSSLRRINEDIKIVRKALDAIEDKMSHTDIPDLFRRVGIKNITVEGVGRASIGHMWGCSIIDKPIGFEWLRSNGHGGLIIETVNASTLAAFAKNLNETEGKELPADKFKTSISAYTSITKAT
jgi:hypothetical protein